MSRIRTIKPEFWTSEQVLACSLQARLLFIGLWNFCDDNGVHPASYVRIKAEVFPVDTCSIKEVQDWINELIYNNLICEYVTEGNTYWLVTGWKKHQRIDKPTYRHPLPSSYLKTIEIPSVSTPIEVLEYSTNDHQVFDEFSTTERNGEEGKGEKINICEVETSPVDVLDPVSSACKQVFEYWQSTMNHPRAKFDSKRKKIITNALTLGYSVDNLKQAIDGCKNSPYNMGKNDREQVYDDIGLIFRDSDHIERFMNNIAGKSAGNSYMTSDDIMAGVI